ncbi:MAG: hypothetical protein EXR62_01260 [Chloroflexi bacterium]|nr:hypothetical protein [Chloroflexota bacterium]
MTLTSSSGLLRRKFFRKQYLVLGLLGLMLALVYWLTFVQPYQLERYNLEPLLDAGKITSYEPVAGQDFTLGVLISFLLYALAVLLAWRLPGLPIFWVLLPALVQIAVMVFAYPALAADVYGYLFQGRIIAIYHENPYLSLPLKFAADPDYAYVAWPTLLGQYGPLWMMLSAVVALASTQGLLQGILAFKGLILVFQILDMALIYVILQRLNPQYAALGVLIFAWNPLSLIEGVANAHNDPVMLTFVLLGIWCLTGRRSAYLAAPAWAVGALIKFFPLLFIPLGVVYLVVRSFWANGKKLTLRFLLTQGIVVMLQALAVGTVLVIGYRPFWAGMETLQGLRDQSRLFTSSLPGIVFQTLRDPLILRGFSEDQVFDLVRWAGLAILAVAYLLLLWHLYRHPTIQTVLQIALLLTWLFLLLITFWFQAWYVLWLLVLAALILRPGAIWPVWSLTLTSTLSYTLYIWIWVNHVDTIDVMRVQWLAVILIYPIPLLLWLLLHNQVPLGIPDPSGGHPVGATEGDV